MAQENLFAMPQSFIEKYFPREYRTIFGMSFALALLTHLYLFTNLFINHDNVNGMFDNCAFGLSSGRWLLHWATKLAGNFSSPWLDGLVGALMLAGACTLFAVIFNICRPFPACLISLCMVAFPTVTSIYTYMFTSSQYFLAMLLAILAVWLLRKEGVGFKLLGAFCIACSMGLYQAFFCLTAAMLVLTMIIEVCKGRWKNSLGNFFITGFCYVGCLALGLVLYLVITKICLWYTGAELVDYQGISNMGQITSSILLQRITAARYYFTSYYFHNPMYSQIFPTLVKVSLAADATVVGILFFTRQLYKSFANLIQLIILVIIFPLACSSIYLMVEPWTVHNLMIYPLILPLLLPVVLGNQVGEQDISKLAMVSKGCSHAIVVLCSCGLLIIQATFGYQFFVVTNKAYSYMDLTYKSAYAYFDRLTTKIELQEGYTPDTPVAFLGNAVQFSAVPDIYVTGVLSLEDIINMYSRPQFLSFFMGSSYHYASQEELDKVKTSPEFQEMPCYPAAGSIETIDGIIVVKLGE